MTKRPLAIELFAGRMGWGRGLAKAGWRVIGFDIEHLPHHGTPPEYCSLVLQDVLTLHGTQLKDARLIVASSPCQAYSYLAMPWSRSTDPNNSKAAKALRKKWETEGPDNRLFDAAKRIQREAIEARMLRCKRCSGRISATLTGAGGNTGTGSVTRLCDNSREAGSPSMHSEHMRRTMLRPGPCSDCCIPLIQENVRGAIPWVGKGDIPLDEWLALSKEQKAQLGKSKANYGSFHLWGDLGMVGNRIIANGQQLRVPRKLRESQKNNGGSWFNIANNTESGCGKNPVHALMKVPGFRFDGSGRSFQSASVAETGIKAGHPERSYRNGHKSTAHLTNAAEHAADGTKIGGDWFSDPTSTCRRHGSRSNARKAASAMIAEIPLPLAEFIGEAFYPSDGIQ